MKKLLNRLTFTLLLMFSVISIFGQCPTGLMSYWKFEETSATVFADHQGTNDAVSDVPVSSVQGEVGNALSFNYNTVDIPGSSFNFASNGSFSIELWVMVPGDGTEGDNDYYVLASRGDVDVPGTYWAIMIDRNTGKVSFDLRDANGTFEYLETATSVINPSNPTWHHIVAVRDDAANKNYLYLDKTPYSKTIDYTGSFTSTSHIAVGYMIRGGNVSYHAICAIDEIAIYNKALSSTDVNANNYKGANHIGICDGYSPKIISLPNQKAQVNSPYSYKVIATGIPTISYSLAVKPNGMTINSGTGQISWTPTSINTEAQVKVVANNPAQAPADTQSFRIFLGQVEACPTNLIALLKLDETSGPTYADHYVSHNASATVAPTAESGKIGMAQSFDGATTGIDIPDNGTEFDWNQTASFSIELWLKTTSLATQVAIARNRLDYDEKLARWFIGTDNGNVMFHLRDNTDPDGDWIEMTSDDPIADGNWHHIVAIHDGSAMVNKLVVDGVEKTEAHTYAHSFNADDPTPVTIGYMNMVSGGQYHFDGSIDEVAIYSRAIPLTEITAYLLNPNGHCAVNNYVPAILSTPKTTASENVAYSYQFSVDDIDEDDVIVLSAPTKPSWLTFNFTPGNKTATLSGTPTSSNLGNNNVTLRVSDGTAQKDQTFVINVANVNDSPEITSGNPAGTVDEDVAYTYTLTVTDADVNDVINMSVVSKPSWMTFNYTAGAKTATLSGTPANGDTGGNIKINITDGTVTVPFEYTLTVNPVNDVPVISGQVSITVDEDAVVTLGLEDLTVTDVDNQASDLSLEVLPGQHYTFENLVVTPDANFTGILTVNVRVHDLVAQSSDFACQITFTPVNDAPVITSTPVDSVEWGSLYAYVFAASDVDNASLTYTAVQIPSWLAFSATSGVLTGTPQQVNVGEYEIKLRVSDGVLTADQTFTLKVTGEPVAVSNFDAAGIKVYPIPAREYLTIQFGKLSENTYAEIISTSGSIIKKSLISKDQVIYNVDLNGIENGTYLLRIRNSNLNTVGRILINK